MPAAMVELLVLTQAFLRAAFFFAFLPAFFFAFFAAFFAMRDLLKLFDVEHSSTLFATRFLAPIQIDYRKQDRLCLSLQKIFQD